MTNQEQATKDVSAAFNELTGTYAQLFQICYDVLAPGRTQADRNKVREVIADYLSARK
jgi:hypothetical protein